VGQADGHRGTPPILPWVSTPPFLELPAGVAARTVDTVRGSFVAFEVGDPADPTALLVPGFTGSKEDFLAVLESLAAAGFHVVAYDQRGQYETPGPPGPEGWTLDGFAADVLALAAVVSRGPVHLLGHSFGGLVARAAVLARPSLFRSLVLLCSGPAGLTGKQAELLEQMAAGIDGYGLATVWTIKHAMDVESGWQPSVDPRVDAFLEERFMANDPGCLASMARILASEPDRTDELRGVAPPVLVAFGVDDDAWTPQIQAETASRLGAETVSFPEAAHSPAAESPGDTVQALAAFWDRVDAAG
jgi:pimeloyl-ACP methyl ester carboxylesterase